MIPLPEEQPARLHSAEHALDGGELLQAIDAELDTEPRLLHAAERSVWLNRTMLVDPDRAGFDPPDNTFRAFQIGAPDRPAESHRGRIGLGDGFVDLVIANDGQSRPKLFLVDQPAAVVDV